MSDNELPKLPGPTKLHTVLPDDYRYGHIYGFTIGQMREYGRACERAAYKRAIDACFEQNDDMASRDYNSAIDDCAVAPQAESKREPLSDEQIGEIQRAAYERAAQECIETAAELRRCADGCTDGRYDWKADGADDCADAIRALGRQQ